MNARPFWFNGRVLLALIVLVAAALTAVVGPRQGPFAPTEDDWAWPSSLAAAFGAAALDADNLLVSATSPCVLFDTRNATDPSFLGTYTGPKTFPTAVGDLSDWGGQDGCGIDPDAVAVVINLIAVTPTGGGNLKAWPATEPEPAGGLVNYQKITPALSNSNATILAVGANASKDVTVKVNGNATHVRGVMLGQLTPADDRYVAKPVPADLSDAIAVSVTDPAASDSPGCGTVASPCQTIAFGLSRALAAAKDRVAVAAGTYWEAVSVVEGIDLEGGWALDFTEQRADIHASQIRPPTADTVALHADSITSPTEVSGFVIVGADAATPGASSVAVLVEDSDSDLVITGNEIRAGDGADGDDGANGGNGGEGGEGTDGTDAVSASAAPIAGGAGGTTTGAGDGGAGGSSQQPSFDVANESGDAGTAQNSSSGGAGGAGGLDAEWASCGVISLPSGDRGGAPGSPGEDGDHGPGGVGASGGAIVGTTWISDVGTSGTNGVGGGGGGGGGAGGGVEDNLGGCNETAGPSGGGGGGGGQSGTGGGAGIGGGASIAVLVTAIAPSSLPFIAGNTIVLGRGGDGGDGGSGGAGGAGGAGGTGGAGTGVTAVDAGDGGAGGAGGHGGGGGGGAGGAAFGLLSGLGPFAGSNVYLTSGASGGAGGKGGISLSDNGTPGDDGVVLDEMTA